MKLWSTHQLLSKAKKLPGELQDGTVGINSIILPWTTTKSRKVPQDCLICLHRPWMSIYLWFINLHSILFRLQLGYMAARKQGITFIIISLYRMCSAIAVSLGTGGLIQHHTTSAQSNAPAHILFPHTCAAAAICAAASEEMWQTCI